MPRLRVVTVQASVVEQLGRTVGRTQGQLPRNELRAPPVVVQALDRAPHVGAQPRGAVPLTHPEQLGVVFRVPEELPPDVSSVG